ncbi:hypothetical protein BKA65DRAFT_584081 [Rhexocercosporidium sp. MPI-PUGE-AT-0058]|nr:hypothetical protein BKA65DRAFT_584081 [Rhexocercosporidium sp. MPI-PUGE-AT-0058]
MSLPVFITEAGGKTLVESRDRSTTSSSGISIPKQSFSPRVTAGQHHSTFRSKRFKINFAALPQLRPISPIPLSEEPMSKMNSPVLPPPRPKSCPMPLLARPTDTNRMSIKNSSFRSSTRPSSSRLSRLSKSPGLTPYNFPTRQPQPDPSWLPAATRKPPKPTYLKTARDRTTAIHGPLHPVIDLPRPPHTTNPRNIQVQCAQLIPETLASSPLELVYDTRKNTFSLERRSALLPHQKSNTPMLEMQENLPPLLVDGRMTVVDIPRWKKTMVLFWRSCDGKKTKVWNREVELPVWVWTARNFGKRQWKVCFIRGD